MLEDIGRILVSAKEITAEELQSAIREMDKNGGSLDYNLIKLGFISEEKIIPFLSRCTGFPSIDLNRYNVDPHLLENIPQSLCQKYKVIPIDRKGNNLTLAMANPLNFEAINEIKFITGCEIRVVVSSEYSILKAIDKFYTREKEWELMVGSEEKVSLAKEEEETRVEALKEAASGPVVKLVNQIIYKAVKKRATDIHFEPFETQFRVRYRIDGVLHEEMFLPVAAKQAFISRLKIMANLDIAEMRLPQDGRIRVKIEKKFIDLRISSVPTIYGEKIVLRISDKTRIKLNLKVLGFSQPDVELIERSLSRPLGLILAVGPSGCGKTTTLYTLIEKLNSPRVNIITTEDPVEYQIKGINQSQINPKIGLTFANSLKYLFRQNPDIIMVGEIRDQETAQTAVRGAITGHLMLSSLHCNDAVSTITRLFNMGVEPYLLASALRLVIAQRLVKKICSECKQEKKYLPEFLSQLGLSSQEIKEIKFYHGVGCEECDQSGYRGQTAVYEILVATPEILNLIFKKAPLDQIKQVALRNGMKPIFHSALLKAKAGITTLEEVMKVSLREE